MDQKAGAQISKKAFIQSALILLLLMIIAGVLTRVLPTGAFDRVTVDGRSVITPGSYHAIPQPHYPVWRWLTAPIEVLWGPDNLVVITIIVFILLVSGAFAVLDKSGILQNALAGIVKRFGKRKYLLLLVISLFFHAFRSFPWFIRGDRSPRPSDDRSFLLSRLGRAGRAGHEHPRH